MDYNITKNYLKERHRMTKGCQAGCSLCSLELRNNGHSIDCRTFEEEYPEEAVSIVQKWSDEHPKMTNKEKFIEVMKNTFGLELKISSNDCPPLATYEYELCQMECEDCKKWWDKPYEE